jgi:hypothetical protein
VSKQDIAAAYDALAGKLKPQPAYRRPSVKVAAHGAVTSRRGKLVGDPRFVNLVGAMVQSWSNAEILAYLDVRPGLADAIASFPEGEFSEEALAALFVRELAWHAETGGASQLEGLGLPPEVARNMVGFFERTALEDEMELRQLERDEARGQLEDFPEIETTPEEWAAKRLAEDTAKIEENPEDIDEKALQRAFGEDFIAKYGTKEWMRQALASKDPKNLLNEARDVLQAAVDRREATLDQASREFAALQPAIEAKHPEVVEHIRIGREMNERKVHMHAAWTDFERKQAQREGKLPPAGRALLENPEALDVPSSEEREDEETYLTKAGRGRDIAASWDEAAAGKENPDSGAWGRARQESHDTGSRAEPAESYEPPVPASEARTAAESRSSPRDDLSAAWNDLGGGD